MIHIERDPNNRKLEIEVNNKLLEIYKSVEPEEKRVINRNDINIVSVEDAMKELLQMGEKI
jgi:hypothetical protein